MIEKVFEIEGKPVKMRASASIPRLYRAKFDRDIIIDMKRLESGMKNGEEPDAIDCEIFENLAFIMARHADSSNVPKTCEEWLDSFDSPLAIYESLKEIIEFFKGSMTTTSDSKKNHVPPNVR